MAFYDDGKDFNFLLFGNSNYNNARTTVLNCSAGLFAKKVAESNGKIAVFCAESDFVLAKKISGEFLNLGKDAVVFTICESVDVKRLLFIAENCDLIVAVGEEPIIKKAKEAAQSVGKKVAAAYTSPKMTNAFSKPYADYILLIDEFYFTNKKQLLAETFGEVVSSLTDLIDYKVAVGKGEAAYDKAAFALLIEGINFALSCQKFSSEKKALSLAALKISLLKEYTDIFKFSASKTVAEYLPKDTPLGERKFRAFKALAPLYKLYLASFGEDLRDLPDSVRAAKELAEFYKEEEYEVVEKFAFYPSEKDLKESERLLKVLRAPLLKDLDAILSKFGYIDELYGYLYSGKKKLANFPPAEMKKAIKAAAFLSENNLLALAKDDGFANFI